jgi:hypothetical protein
MPALRCLEDAANLSVIEEESSAQTTHMGDLASRAASRAVEGQTRANKTQTPVVFLQATTVEEEVTWAGQLEHRGWDEELLTLMAGMA